MQKSTPKRLLIVGALHSCCRGIAHSKPCKHRLGRKSTTFPGINAKLLSCQKQEDKTICAHAVHTRRKLCVIQHRGKQRRVPLQVVSSLESEGRHAFLHDFCMIIPYSGIVVLAGLVSIPFGSGWRGVLLAAAGALELAISVKSLKQFQEEKKSTPYTLMSAGIAAGLAAHFLRVLRRQTTFWPKALLSSMTVLSFCALAFLVYNVLSGGNPPKEDKAITVEDSSKPQKAY